MSSEGAPSPQPHHKESDMALKSLLEILEPIPCKQPPVLGEAIPWKQVEGQFLRVRWCSFLTSIQDGTIEPGPMGSYAALGVESPSLAGEAFIVVSNEVDFGHLWELYRQRQVADDEEVLLVYAPVEEERLRRLLRMSLPCLDIRVYPKGHFKEAYNPEFRPLSLAAWNQERARWIPSEPRGLKDSACRTVALQNPRLSSPTVSAAGGHLMRQD